MQGSEKGKTGSAKHGEVEVSDHKMGVMNMDIRSRCTQYKAGQAAHCKKVDEDHGIEKRWCHLDRALIHCADPGKDLYRGRNGDQICEQGKDKDRGIAHTTGVHVYIWWAQTREPATAIAIEE